MMEFVSRDDDIPNIWKKMFQTTKQKMLFFYNTIYGVFWNVSKTSHTYIIIYIYNVHIIYIMLIALHSQYIIVTVENHHV